mmetsp:Transcript_2356/g.7163  ORF Transcript_2356/g.7163 Transcript_2356/m.7163 type:complete len:84 (-) Transcript_2356:1489-1740(-)
MRLAYRKEPQVIYEGCSSALPSILTKVLPASQLVVMPLTHRTQEGQDMDEEARQTFRYLQYGTKAAVAFLLNLERKQGERKRP